MKKLFISVFFFGMGLSGVIYAQDMHKVQCKLENAVLNSNLEQVRHSLNQGAKARKKITCLDDFKGKSVKDLADNRVAHWKKQGDQKKLGHADAVRDTIVNAIGRELSGQVSGFDY